MITAMAAGITDPAQKEGRQHVSPFPINRFR
jgi:hypothetical protein